jgi:hypothetical protein
VTYTAGNRGRLVIDGSHHAIWKVPYQPESRHLMAALWLYSPLIGDGEAGRTVLNVAANFVRPEWGAWIIRARYRELPTTVSLSQVGA